VMFVPACPCLCLCLQHATLHSVRRTRPKDTNNSMMFVARLATTVHLFM
jgi:hypothetical protein